MPAPLVSPLDLISKDLLSFDATMQKGRSLKELEKTIKFVGEKVIQETKTHKSLGDHRTIFCFNEKKFRRLALSSNIITGLFTIATAGLTGYYLGVSNSDLPVAVAVLSGISGSLGGFSMLLAAPYAINGVQESPAEERAKNRLETYQNIYDTLRLVAEINSLETTTIEKVKEASKRVKDSIPDDLLSPKGKANVIAKLVKKLPQDIELTKTRRKLVRVARIRKEAQSRSTLRTSHLDQGSRGHRLAQKKATKNENQFNNLIKTMADQMKNGLGVEPDYVVIGNDFFEVPKLSDHQVIEVNS